MFHIYKLIKTISEAIVRVEYGSGSTRLAWVRPQCDSQHYKNIALKAIQIFLLEGPTQSCWSLIHSVLNTLA